MGEQFGPYAADGGAHSCGQSMLPVFWSTLVFLAAAAICAAAAGLRAMAVVCALCATLQLFTLTLLYTQRKQAAGLLFSLGMACGMIASAAAGCGLIAGFWALPGVLLQMLPYAARRARRMAGVVVAAGLAACLIFPFLIPAPQFSAGAGRVLATVSLGGPAAAVILFCYAMLRSGAQAGRHAAMNEQLRRDAYYDVLTGLRNRRSCEQTLRSVAGRPDAACCCLAMLDVDDFKAVNDRYGHLAGDYVLQQITGTVRRMLRRQDVVFRWGGEEFLFLLRDVDPETAHGIMDRIRAALENRQLRVRGRLLEATVTIGVAPFDPHDISGSIDRCDAKMYDGKRGGKNCVVV